MAPTASPWPTGSWPAGRTRRSASTTPGSTPGTGCLPTGPTLLRLFLAKITRRVALNRWKASQAQKRGQGELPLVLEELAQCLAQEGDPVTDAAVARELGECIRAFVRALPAREGTFSPAVLLHRAVGGHRRGLGPVGEPHRGAPLPHPAEAEGPSCKGGIPVNREDLYEAAGHIDEDILARSEGPRRPRRGRWLGGGGGGGGPGRGGGRAPLAGGEPPGHHRLRRPGGGLSGNRGLSQRGGLPRPSHRHSGRRLLRGLRRLVGQPARPGSSRRGTPTPWRPFGRSASPPCWGARRGRTPCAPP